MTDEMTPNTIEENTTEQPIVEENTTEQPTVEENAASEKPDAPVSEEEAEKKLLEDDKELLEMQLAEIRKKMETMTDNDIKSKANQLRNAIERDEKALRAVFRELKNHRADTDDLRKKRDELNEKVRELSKAAQKCRAARDEINAKIAEIKKERTGIIADSKERSETISTLKAKRDELNKVSQGTCDSLAKGYRKDLETFLNADIALDHEKDLFDRLQRFPERLSAAQEANVLHRKIQETYDSSKGVYTRNDELSAEIKKLSEESQKHHLEMIDGYHKVDEVRKEADSCHRRLTEKYTLTKPISAKIDPLRKSIARARAELDVYLEKTKEIQDIKDEKRMDKNHDSAREKLKNNGRLSLEDLSVLIEKGDIEFEK